MLTTLLRFLTSLDGTIIRRKCKAWSRIDQSFLANFLGSQRCLLLTKCERWQTILVNFDMKIPPCQITMFINMNVDVFAFVETLKLKMYLHKHRVLYATCLLGYWILVFMLFACAIASWTSVWTKYLYVQVVWGKISMVEAEKRLLANALQDPDNQQFVLLSDRWLIFLILDFFCHSSSS